MSLELSRSTRRVGKLYPVLLDRHGNIVDGVHRLSVDASWPKIRLKHLASDEERLLARLVSNVCRRRMSTEEKRRILEELGKIYLSEEHKVSRIARRIARETGMTYRWVMKYLPESLKERPGMGGPHVKGDPRKNPVERCSTAAALLMNHSGLTEKGLTVSNYANTNFVHIVLDRWLYEKIQRVAESLGTTADTLIASAILSVVKDWKMVATAIAGH